MSALADFARRARTPRATLVLALLAAVSAAGAVGCCAAGATAAVTPRVSLPAIERRVMCVTCKIPLIVAESSQADRERVFIEGLIGEGKTEAQIEQALVAQYGPAALGLPSAHGFDLTAYLVPLAAFAALLATLALLLPRWRRHARAQASEAVATPTLTAADSARLDADLAKLDR